MNTRTQARFLCSPINYGVSDIHVLFRPEYDVVAGVVPVLRSAVPRFSKTAPPTEHLTLCLFFMLKKKHHNPPTYQISVNYRRSFSTHLSPVYRALRQRSGNSERFFLLTFTPGGSDAVTLRVLSTGDPEVHVCRFRIHCCDLSRFRISY